MAYLTSFLIPLACVMASVFINALLAQAGVIERSSLEGSPPPIFDVSIQLIFISVGSAISVAVLDRTKLPGAAKTLPDRAILPLVLSFFGICLICGFLAFSVSASAWKGWLRVYLPDLVGAIVLGVTIWNLRTFDGN